MPRILKVYRHGRCSLKVEVKTRRLLYHYSAGDWAFEFDLFSEVGAPFQPIFAALMRIHGLEVETVEVPHKPWIYDRLRSLKACSPAK